jgi:hypothetical protein
MIFIPLFFSARPHLYRMGPFDKESGGDSGPRGARAASLANGELNGCARGGMRPLSSAFSRPSGRDGRATLPTLLTSRDVPGIFSLKFNADFRHYLHDGCRGCRTDVADVVVKIDIRPTSVRHLSLDGCRRMSADVGRRMSRMSDGCR